MRSLSCYYLFALALCLYAVPTAAEETPLAQSTDIAAVKKALKMSDTETAIFVGDMHCAGCAKKVARKLYGVKGVVKVRSDLKLDVAIVTPQRSRELDPKALWAATEKSGIPPIKLIGPTGVIEVEAEGKKAAQKPTHDFTTRATTTK